MQSYLRLCRCGAAAVQSGAVASQLAGSRAGRRRIVDLPARAVGDARCAALCRAMRSFKTAHRILTGHLCLVRLETGDALLPVMPRPDLPHRGSGTWNARTVESSAKRRTPRPARPTHAPWRAAPLCCWRKAKRRALPNPAPFFIYFCSLAPPPLLPQSHTQTNTHTHQYIYILILYIYIYIYIYIS